jgi:phospholipase/lecithinase/hemolysin
MRTHIFRSAIIALLLFCVLGQPTTAAHAFLFDRLYAFGDSLGDNGNVFLGTRALGMDPAVPPSQSPHRTYFNGRFSNGFVAFEYLWQHISGFAPGTNLGLTPYLADPLLLRPAVDFAFGGTGTPLVDQTPGGFYAPGLKGQVELFRFAMRDRRPSTDALFAIVTGANDYRDDPFNVPMEPAAVVANIAQSVQTLYALGARNFVVLSLPDLGQVPANFPMAAYWTALSHQHNDLLQDSLQRLTDRLPRLNIHYVDVDTVFGLLPPGMIRTFPAIDALHPAPLPPPVNAPMSACLFINPALCEDLPTFDVGDDFLFWDIVHPTTAAHRILAQFIFDGLSD